LLVWPLFATIAVKQYFSGHDICCAGGMIWHSANRGENFEPKAVAQKIHVRVNFRNAISLENVISSAPFACLGRL
jgi:hypothetical protein